MKRRPAAGQKNPGGRPDKLRDPEVRARFVQAIELTATVEDAALYAGVDKSTVYRELQLGRDAKSGWRREFSDAVERARVKAKLALLGQVVAGTQDRWDDELGPDGAVLRRRLASRGDWKAAAWLLARRYRDEFRDPARELPPSPEPEVADEELESDPEVVRRTLREILAVLTPSERQALLAEADQAVAAH